MLTRSNEHRHERGSVVLALLVMMVITLLGITALVRSRHALTSSRIDTDEGRAAASAELAINEAFARIDAGESTRFSGAGSHDQTTYSYRADPAGSGTWSIRAEATSNDLKRAMSATVTRDPLYAYSLFATDSISVDRNTGRISGRVGTNGEMKVTGPSPGDRQDLYLPDGACTGCVAPVTLDGPRRVALVEIPAGTVRDCPQNGIFVNIVDGRGGVPFVCHATVSSVVFEGVVKIENPPLIVYVDAGIDVVLDDATVDPPGRASGFRLFVAGESGDSVDSISASRAELNGLIYAPGRSLRTDALKLAGSITLRTLDVPRKGRVSISDDQSISALGNDVWRLVDLRFVPSTP